MRPVQSLDFRDWTAFEMSAMSRPAKLIFFCGKMAAGKSTLARELSEREDAILFTEVISVFLTGPVRRFVLAHPLNDRVL